MIGTPGIFEKRFDLDDPALDASMAAFCEMAIIKIQAQGGTGAVALKKIEGRSLFCLIVTTGLPTTEETIADHKASGYSVGDQLAVKHRPAPETGTGDLMKKVLEAQRKAQNQE